MVITMKSQGSIHELAMGTSVISGNLLRIKSDFIWVRLLSPKLDINLKLIGINGSDLFMKGLS